MATEWDLAGFTKPGSGIISRAIPPTCIFVPGEIDLVNGCILWQLEPDISKRMKEYKPASSLLNEFAQLWAMEDETILYFARKNGVLWRDADGYLCRLGVSGSEPLSTWRRLSVEICALLRIAYELATNKTWISVEQWKYVAQFDAARLEQLKKPANSRVELAKQIRSMLADWGFGFSFGITSKKTFELQIDYRGFMLNAVVLQLALTVSKSENLFMCSGCGHPYSRPAELRRPKSGQANFCGECGQKAALQQADLRRKAKMAEARRLASQGIAAGDIAAKLDSNIKSVRKWISRTKTRLK